MGERAMGNDRAKKVVIIDQRFPSHAIEREALSDTGAQVIETTGAVGGSNLAEECRDADVIIVNLAPITAGIIDRLERCRGIVRYGVGYDSVDVDAASRRGIPVANVPDFCVEEVSDQAIGLWLACARQIVIRDRTVRAGVWDPPSPYPILRTAGKTFGIFGYGRIARTLHRKLAGFSLGRILVHDPYVSDEEIRGTGAEPVSFETLLRESDVVSVHSPLTKENRHRFSSREFAMMKPTAIFLNTARGGIVDTSALAEALRSGGIMAAGVDVHETEPVGEEYMLRDLQNVVLSDHRGWYSVESTAELQRKAALAARELLFGRLPPSTVNRDRLSGGEPV